MPESSDAGILVLVVHWNRPEECIATVRQLREQTTNSRIVVIDNASDSHAYGRLQSALPDDAELRRLSGNRGWGGAINSVLREWLQEEREPYALISAHDALPAPGCVDLLCAAMQREGRIGIACPQYEDNSIAVLSRWHGVSQRFAQPRRPGTPQTVDVPHGTLMMIRRECLRQIGCFDERYFAYGDEHDLGARATRANWKVCHVWGAVVTNPGTWTPSALRSYFFARNSLLLVRTHFGAGSALLRAAFLTVSALRSWLTPHQGGPAFSPAAHFRGLRDYLLGRFGFPSWAR
jgi:GT2 family glycosyltransferase